MLSILVCHSYFLRFDEKQRQRAKPYPPLATLQVASLLRIAGHRVSVFDAMLAASLDDYRAALRSASPNLVVFYEDNYNFLSKMCLGKMREACCEMIASARSGGARVVAAGSDASDAPDRYLAAGADAVLLGEGLAALMALVDRLGSDASLPVERLVSGLPDVSATIGGKTLRSSAAAPLPEPELPKLSARDLIDLDEYRAVWRGAHGYFSLNMAASRGCSFRCDWCAKPIWGNRYLQRAAADVAAEMLLLKREYAPDHVWFADDIFGFRVDWVRDFAAALREGGGGVPFTIQIRADLASPSMAVALREAGCREAWIGAESGSQKILDAMHKGTRVADIVDARSALGAEGIRVGFFLMLGYVGEELEDILATRDLVERARPDDIGVSVAYPLPGTKFFELVKRELGAKRNWDDSDDLDMMFFGTYRSELYRSVRNLLHAQVTEGHSPAIRPRWDELVRSEAQFRQIPAAVTRLAGHRAP
ncbi:MAG TPA: radical SAM protein [Gammaproteobacteria bacterium]|nr:radical SAM protein [Gammaproteobacteria bacterium]